VVLLTLVIGVLNVALGFAVAVYLGYGPPGLWEAWESLSFERSTPHQLEPAVGGAAIMSTEQLLEGLGATGLEQLLDDAPDEDAHDKLEVETYDEVEERDDEDVSSLLNPDAPEIWDINEKYVETSILKLNIAMMKSGAKATRIDTRLRACRGHADAETIRTCLAELKEDCQLYLTEQSDAATRFSERINELGELSSLGEEIEMANLEQSAQVETTLTNLKHMDFQSDLETANKRLLEELHNLRVARHKLRDHQEVAFLAVARHQDRMGNIEARLYDDPLTRLRNRIGIETTLWNWWKQGRTKSRQMSAVLFDLDDFDHVNQSHGSLVGDRILYQFAQMLKASFGKGDLLGRYAGQRFLAVICDVGPRTATKNAETIRQTLEKTTFVSGKNEINVTTCLGLTEVKPQDTEAAVFGRLEKALAEAKKARPNCAFFHDGEDPELVESPNFGAKPVEIEIGDV